MLYLIAVVISSFLYSASVSLGPSLVLCSLERFSGFADELASLNTSAHSHSLLTAHYEVAEKNYWPPLEQQEPNKTCTLEKYQYPNDISSSRRPSRYSSRLTLVVNYGQSELAGYLEIATAIFVSLSPVLSYLLPAKELRARLTTCSSSLLAAVVQVRLVTTSFTSP